MPALSVTKYSSIYIVFALIAWVPRVSGQVDLALLAATPGSTTNVASASAPSGVPVPTQRASSKEALINKLGDRSPIFIENKGQFDSRVKFQVRSGSKTLWLTSQGIVFDVIRSKPATGKPQTGSASAKDLDTENGPLIGTQRDHNDRDEYERLVFAQDFVAANTTPVIEPY